MADDELIYTKIGIDQAGDIVGRLMSACVCGPLDPDDACLSCCARTEIERLRAQVAELLPWAEAQAMAIVEIAVGDRHFAAADLLGRIAADEFETPEEWAKRVVDEWHNYTKNGIDEPPAGE